MKTALHRRYCITQNTVMRVSRCVQHRRNLNRVEFRRVGLRCHGETEPTKQMPTELEGASTDLEVIYERLVKVCALYTWSGP
jgi:hypothetical protein